VGVASSLVQLTRSLGGTLGVALLGAYMGARMADLIGGAVASPRDLVDVLRPEALAALSPGAVTLLRAELADTLRTMFAVGAVVMTTAAAFAFRLGHVEVVQRRSRRRAVERVSLPNVPIETDAGKL